MAPSLAVSGVVCCGSLVVLLLYRLWRVHARAAAHRKRRHQPRAWVELASTWHTPLLLLGLAIAAARLAFFIEIYVLSYHHDSTSQRRRLWFWLELPSALVAIATAYLLFFHAHVALYRIWPIRFDSTAMAFRVLLSGFCSLLVVIVVLLAYGHEASEPLLSPSQWTQLSLQYCAVVWIALGAMLLKFTGESADVMWTERNAGRLLVISLRSLHALATTETLFALTAIVRGLVAGALATAAASPLPVDPSSMGTTAFFLLYGLWELATLGMIHSLCGCVPVVSRARRLVGFTEDAESGKPVLNHRPVLHFELPSPAQAVQGYLRTASRILQRPSQRASRLLDDVEMEEEEAEDCLLLDGDSFREPLLADPQDHDELEETLDRRGHLYGIK